jgi:hypothetical protein
LNLPGRPHCCTLVQQQVARYNHHAEDNADADAGAAYADVAGPLRQLALMLAQLVLAQLMLMLVQLVLVQLMLMLAQLMLI